ARADRRNARRYRGSCRLSVPPRRVPLNGAAVASPTVSHRLIIADDASDRVIAVDTGDGTRLPYVDTEDRHTADTDYLNAAVLARWGLRCTVLQSLYHSAEADARIERVHELELHESTALQRWGA